MVEPPVVESIVMIPLAIWTPCMCQTDGRALRRAAEDVFRQRSPRYACACAMR